MAPPAGDMGIRLLDKRTFFKALHAVDDSDDEQTDEGRLESISMLGNASRVDATGADMAKRARLGGTLPYPNAIADTNQRRSMIACIDPERPRQSESDGIARSASDTNLVRLKDREAPNGESLSEGRPLPPSLQQRHTFHGAMGINAGKIPPSSAIPRAIGKRKREGTVVLVPEGQRIFRDLHLYFFPNNDTHPARRMRITKSLEFGATWQKDWSDQVTHAVVDKSMKYELLTKYLKLDNVPSRIAVVDESYLAECISYRLLLNPNQVRFRIKGYVVPKAAQPTIEESSRPISSQSEKSLQLKPAGKHVTVRQPETQSKTEEGAPEIATDASPD